jgi:small GTP-binding protein
LTDTAGQEEYRGLQSAYSRQADAFLLVYDITNPASLHDQLPYFLDLIAMETETREDEGKVPPIKIVAGNKCDLNDDRKISAGEGLKWARANGCGFMETSAREFVNVEETFTRKFLFVIFLQYL